MYFGMVAVFSGYMKISASRLRLGQEVREMVGQANTAPPAVNAEIHPAARRCVLHFLAHAQELGALELNLLPDQPRGKRVTTAKVQAPQTILQA